ARSILNVWISPHGLVRLRLWSLELNPLGFLVGEVNCPLDRGIRNRNFLYQGVVLIVAEQPEPRGLTLDAMACVFVSAPRESPISRQLGPNEELRRAVA